MTVTDSRPNELIRIRLDFLKPFAGTSTAEFTFGRGREQTAVSVEHDRPQQLHRQAFCPLHQHGQDDRRQFEKGLAEMKVAAERPRGP
jgi:hypothetical protein